MSHIRDNKQKERGEGHKLGVVYILLKLTVEWTSIQLDG